MMFANFLLRKTINHIRPGGPDTDPSHRYAGKFFYTQNELLAIPRQVLEPALVGNALCPARQNLVADIVGGVLLPLQRLINRIPMHNGAFQTLRAAGILSPTDKPVFLSIYATPILTSLNPVNTSILVKLTSAKPLIIAA